MPTKQTEGRSRGRQEAIAPGHIMTTVGVRCSVEWAELLSELTRFTNHESRSVLIGECVRSAARVVVEYAISTGKAPTKGPDGQPIDLGNDVHLAAAIATMRRMARPVGMERMSETVDAVPNTTTDKVEA